jgi:hypothetical protein
VVVDADMTWETRLLTSSKLFWLSPAILFRAVLSSTTVQSVFNASLFKVSNELYGYTTTSLSSFGNTEYVYINFLGNLSFSFSSKYEPRPEPVPPAIE